MTRYAQLNDDTRLKVLAAADALENMTKQFKASLNSENIEQAHSNLEGISRITNNILRLTGHDWMESA
jgi:ribosomal protein L18